MFCFGRLFKGFYVAVYDSRGGTDWVGVLPKTLLISANSMEDIDFPSSLLSLLGISSRSKVPICVTKDEEKSHDFVGIVFDFVVGCIQDCICLSLCTWKENL